MKLRHFLLLQATLIPLTVGGRALADMTTLPPANGYVSDISAVAQGATVSNPAQTIPGTEESASSHSIGSPVGSASASSVVSASAAAVSASASALEAMPPAEQFFASGAGVGDTSLQYFFEVVSPTTTDIGLLIQARGGITASAANSGSIDIDALADLGIGLASAGSGPPLSINDQLQLNDDVGGVSSEKTGNATISGTRATGFTGVIAEHQVATIQTNTLYDVALEVSLYADQYSANDAGPEGDYGYTGGIVPGGKTTVSAFVDPYFSVAPGTPNLGEYSLVFSSGVGNPPIATGVPEPSTWALLLIGFAGLGFAAFRRSRESGVGSPRFSSPTGDSITKERVHV